MNTSLTCGEAVRDIDTALGRMAAQVQAQREAVIGQWVALGYTPGSSNRPNGRTVANIGEWRVPFLAQAWCMEVDWLVSLQELSQMVPPRYTLHLGRQLLSHVERAAA